MLHHLPAPAFPIDRCLGALALAIFGLAAGPAGALPPVEPAPPPGLVLAQAGAADAEPRSQDDRPAPFTDLERVLEATRAKLEELTEATATVAANSELRKEVQGLERDNERLVAEIAQARTRQAELEKSGQLAEARVAELTAAVETAEREARRADEALARLRRQNAQLNQGLARADSARETAVAEAEKARVELAAQLEAAGAAERLSSELAALKEQLGQAAGAAVEAERARQAASEEAESLRRATARAQDELIAANAEIASLRIANAELEEEMASWRASSTTAIETARQNLVMMEEKIAQLNTALALTPPVQATPAAVRAPRKPAAPEDQPPAATGAPAIAQPGAPGTPGGAGAELPTESARAPSGTELSTAGPAAAPGQADSRLSDFQAKIQALNDLELSTEGIDLFSGIASVKGRTVHVAATTAWDALPAVGKESYLDSLLDHWVAAQVGPGPAVVRIVDPDGRVLVEKSQP
jgi:hypothetical protein